MKNITITAAFTVNASGTMYSINAISFQKDEVLSPGRNSRLNLRARF